MKDLTQVETEPMSMEDMQMFMMLTMMSQKDESLPAGVMEKDPCARIIKGRMPESDGVDDFVIAMASSLSGGSPGNCVMWAYTLHSKSIKNMTDLTYAFPDGFPTMRGYHDMWDSQKEGGLNKLDQAETWDVVRA